MRISARNNNRAAWITWESQVRNRSMARVLNIPLYEFASSASRLLRYPILSYRTCRVIFKNRIKILFVQNPSIVLSFLAICLKQILHIQVLIDAHNSGIYPLEGRSKTLNFFARFICRKADVVVVTNSYLAEIVKDWGGNPFVMPDPIPDFSHLPDTEAVINEGPYVLMICTWAADEPYMEVIEAASLFAKDGLSVFITGNFRKRLTGDQIGQIPPNVKLLGFIPESKYIVYLKSAIAIIDLTTRDNCLVCGAYEAAAVGTPGILSDTEVNREVFNRGYLYTRNSAIAIAATVLEAAYQETYLRQQLVEFRSSHQSLIEKKVEALKAILSNDLCKL